MKVESKKLGKKVAFKINGYNGTYGTLNSHEMKGAYVEFCGWVLPTNSYIRDIDRFKQRFQHEMDRYIKKEFKGDTTYVIYSIEHRQTGNNEDKFTLLPIDVTLLYKPGIIWKEQIIPLDNLSHHMIDYVSNYKDLIFNHIKYK